MRVMIVVTHLLGTGHLARALTLAHTFAAAGDDVSVVSGGVAVPHFDASGLRFVQLPALRSDGTDFTRLLDEDGTEADAAYRQGRITVLLDALREVRPDVLITELFPFGRRNLRDEFGALLQAAKDVKTPLVLSSVRDILAPPSKQAKAAFAVDMIAAYYDRVLVHSDPTLVPLELSWPVSDILRPKLVYTGFVAPPPPRLSAEAQGDILVSAGGGSVGEAVFIAACAAARQLGSLNWRLLVGGSDDRRATLAKHAPENVIVQAPRPDFRDMLAGAAASVSMCGYNTAMDILQTGVPAVLVPFDDGGEVEQGLRAKALASLQAVEVLAQSDLTAESLVTALRNVRNAPHRPAKSDGMSGAETTVRIVRTLLQETRR